MARRYFNTKEAAERHLEVRRKAAYKRIEKKGWKVLGDDSFVIKELIWSKPKKLSGCDLYSRTQTDVPKWVVWLMITTDEMIKDLLSFKSVDASAELEAILKKMK